MSLSPRVGATVALIAACVAPSLARAYVPSTTNESLKPLRWTESNCVIMRPNSKGSADVTDGSDVAAVLSSAERWHTAAGHCAYIRFSMQPATLEAKAGFSQGSTNENAIVWVEAGWRDELKHDPQAAGLTTVFFVDSPGSSRDGKILDADIELNGEFFRFSARPETVKGRTDIENTVVHEMGHVLGLDHPCDDGLREPVPMDHTGATIPKCSASLPQEMVDRTMFNFAEQAEDKKRTPEADDVLGICQTYPPADDPGICAPPATDEPGCRVSGASAFAANSFTSGPFVGALLALLALVVISRRRRPHH